MKIWLYTILRDEIRILPYFLRHYEPWVDKLIFYDDQSTDGTRELLESRPQCELRNWPGRRGIVDTEFLAFAHHQWKEACGQADWVVWVDADEFVYHPDIRLLLERYLNEGVQVPKVLGYTMVSKEFPTTSGQIYEEVQHGVPDDVWNKPAVFRDMAHFTMGRHGWDYTKSRPKTSKGHDLKLLHMRGLGMPYVRWRHARNWARVPEDCRAMNLGTNTSPTYDGHHGLDWFERLMAMDLPKIVFV